MQGEAGGGREGGRKGRDEGSNHFSDIVKREGEMGKLSPPCAFYIFL